MIPHRRGTNPPGGAPTYDFAKFSKTNCMKFRKFGPWGRTGVPPLDPPLCTYLNYVGQFYFARS